MGGQQGQEMGERLGASSGRYEAEKIGLKGPWRQEEGGKRAEVRRAEDVMLLDERRPK